MTHFTLRGGKMISEGYRNITRCHIGEGVHYLHLCFNYFYVAVTTDFPTWLVRCMPMESTFLFLH